MPKSFSRPHAQIMVDKGRLDRARVAAYEGRIEAATNIARTIVEDWYRCQALTQIAEHLPDRSKVLSMLSEALEAAYLTEEPNRIVVVGALPISVLSRTREFDVLQTEVDSLIDVANSEPHPTRRIDAFYWLWSRLRTGLAPDEILRQVLGQFWETAEAGHGWKRDRCLRYVSVMLARRGWQTEADKTANLIENRKVKRQAYREIQCPPAGYDYAERRPVEFE